MARKDLLRGLMGLGDGAQAGGGDVAMAPAPPAPAAPRVAKGAIGAVGQSIADLRARSIIEVSPDLIDDAGAEDRLDADAEGILALSQSLRAYGQQVPVLLRPSVKVEGRYDVVYGRRRVAALRLAEMPVKALVRVLDDRDLIIAQGQENAHRKDLSFVEKANFARQLRDQGFDRAVICDALAVDKTVISRMLQVADAVPTALLHAIGAAPAAGRDRWLALAKALEGALEGADVNALTAKAVGADSDRRFEAIFGALTAVSAKSAPKARPALPAPVARTEVAELHREANGARALRLTPAAAAGFEDWLLAELPRLHAAYLAATKG